MAISTYVAVPTLAVGDKLTAARWNTIGTALSFLLAPPEAVATNTAGTSIANTTEVVVPLAGETVDTGPSWDGAMHDNVTNNSRVTFTTTGRYDVEGYTAWAANATGYRRLNLRKNAAGVAGGGTLLKAWAIAPANTATEFTYVGLRWTDTFVAGDYVELFGTQGSGGALALATGSPNGNYLRVRLAGN